MSPPLKRQRSSSDASPPVNDDSTSQMDVTVDTQHESQANEISEPERHKTLWYEDGNVVLRTDEHLYRVHKSVLSRQSSVFKDMFHVTEDAEGETKDAADSNSVLYEGLPLIALPEDSDEDVCNFLSTLYSRSFFRMHERTSLSILVSLSRMSTKYNAVEIRSELISHLAQIYPDTLAAYELNRWNTLFEGPPPDLDFHLLALARECGAHVLLPALFYACATQPLPLILDSSSIVSQRDHKFILEGREKLMKFSYEVATKALLQGKKCRSAECANRRTNAIMGHIDYSKHDPPPFIFHVSTNGVLPTDPVIRAEIRKACVKNYQDSLQALRDSLWVDLPSLFSLKKWSKLRQLMSESAA